MPLEAIPGVQAFENSRANSQNSWPARGGPEDRVGPLARPMFHPSFSLERGDRVFTIGSCFARNLEPELYRLGFDVPMLEVSSSTGATAPGDLFNYGAPSIFNELEWALDPERPFDPATGLIEVTKGGYCDLHLSRLSKPLSLEGAMERRARIKTAMATAADCRVIIITLGLVEVWWDAAAGRYLNIAPPKQIVKKYPDRFELHVLSVEEVGDYLDRAFQLLLKFGRRDQRILLTVSPVPLAVTFTQGDVMVANAYSKSVLRVAAQQLWSKYDHVDYYPSYESVTLSERGLAFENDNRHVRHELIELNVGRMVAAYTGEGDGRLYELALSAEKGREFAEAESLYRQVLAQQKDPRAKAGLARALRGQRRFDEALAVLAGAELDTETTITLARTLCMAGRPAEAEPLLPALLEINTPQSLVEAIFIGVGKQDFAIMERGCDALEAVSPRSFIPFQYRGMSRLRQGKPREALGILEQGVMHSQNSVELFVLLGEARAAVGLYDGARDAFQRALTLNPMANGAVDGLQALPEPGTPNLPQPQSEAAPLETKRQLSPAEWEAARLRENPAVAALLPFLTNHEAGDQEYDSATLPELRARVVLSRLGLLNDAAADEPELALGK